MKYHFSVFVLFPVFGGSDPEKSLPIPMSRSEFLMFSHFLKKVLLFRRQSQRGSKGDRDILHPLTTTAESWATLNPGTQELSPGLPHGAGPNHLYCSLLLSKSHQQGTEFQLARTQPSANHMFLCQYHVFKCYSFLIYFIMKQCNVPCFIYFLSVSIWYFRPFIIPKLSKNF